MTIPTAAEIEAIRKRDSEELNATDGFERYVFKSFVRGKYHGMEAHVVELLRDRRTLLAALDAVTVERDKYKQLAAAFIAMG